MDCGESQKDISQYGALNKLLVVDLSRVLAGPYAGQILGDLGADVIKVERPYEGDDGRRFGINALPDEHGKRSDNTSFHLAANRNKRSLTLDLSKPEGQQALLKILDKADVLIENFRVGTLKRFGLDYEAVRERNPALIYCSVTGYGQDGPYAKRPGYDGVFQAQCGLMNVTGPAEEEPDSAPYKAGPSLIDISTGMYAAIGILAALHHRAETGAGQYIDISLLDSGIAMMSHSAMEFLISGKTLPRVGNQGNGGAPATTFNCIDGQIYLSPGRESHFRSLCRILQLEYLTDIADYSTPAKRFANRKALNPVIEEACAKWPVDALSEALNEADVPAGVVNDYARVFSDPQVLHRAVKVAIPHPATESVSLIASPIRMSRTPPTYRRLPPGLGAHSDEILHDLAGYDAQSVAAMRRRGIV